ncbi:MAG: peptide deformylase [Pseudomonadales bacterium]
MALLEILEFPDTRLRTVAKPVTEVDGKIASLADNLLETMYTAPGIGLAASQVNVHQRLLVCDISDARDQPLILINPEIIAREGEIETNEGCLSVPGFYEPVFRSEQIQVRAINREGEEISMEAEGLLAVCIQHEMDHLEGKLFVDYLSNTKRQLIRKKLLKSQKQPVKERA